MLEPNDNHPTGLQKYGWLLVSAAIMLLIGGVTLWRSFRPEPLPDEPIPDVPTEIATPTETEISPSPLPPLTLLDPVPAIEEIKGLPMKYFTYSDNQLIEYIDYGTNLQEYFELFRYPNRQAALTSFAVLYVLDTEVYSEWHGDYQRSTVQVLYSVGAKLPETLEIEQRDNTVPPSSNFVRRGGVYVMLLSANEWYYDIHFDNDALLEVAESGWIFTHSEHKGITKYAGWTLPKFWEEIQQMYENPVLTSQLAIRFHNERPLGTAMTGIVTGVDIGAGADGADVYNIQVTEDFFKFYNVTDIMAEVSDEVLEIGQEYIFYGFAYSGNINADNFIRLDKNERICTPFWNLYGADDGITFDELREALAEILNHYVIVK